MMKIGMPGRALPRAAALRCGRGRSEIGRCGRVWLLSGGLLLLAACNRVEPEKSSSGQSALSQQTSANAAALSDGAASAEQLAQQASSGQTPASSQQLANDLAGQSSKAPSPVTTTAAAMAAPGGKTADASVAPASGTKPNDSAGVHIEFAAPSFPSTGLDTAAPSASGDLSQRLSDRAFMQLKLPEANEPTALFAFFSDCDRAVQDLAFARHAEQLSQEEFHEQAKRLSAMKLDASQRLLSLPGLTPQQQKGAMAAQVESLSHLTGLGDVDAAKNLQALAERLTQSEDKVLAHQGRLVLLGFQLNQLQEGQLKDPQSLVSDVDRLFASSDERSLVEMMALQRCAEVLTQLGYSDESKQVLERVIREYRNSPDIDLSMRAWSMETEGSPTLVAFHDSLKAHFEGKAENPASAAAAARSFWQAFPTINTLLYISRSMIPLEFSGNVAAASELAKAVAEARKQLPASSLVTEIDTFLDCHNRRLAAVGKPLALEELVTFEGKPFDWSSYRGKVVLVCFWASWEINSLEEMRRLKDLRQEIPVADFDVVAINLDDVNKSSAEQMVARQAYPFVNVRSSNPGAVGFSTPAAQRIGVNAVPFLMLVDRSGSVAAIHVRGEKAPAMINELLSRR